MRSVLMVDVDGVLVHGRPADGKPFATDLEADLGVSLAKLQAEFFEPHWEAIVTGRAAMMDRLPQVLTRLAPAVTPQQFLNYWFENDSRLDRAMVAALRRHRAGGVKVFLATNQEHLRASWLMEKLGLAAEVDGILYSAALGDRKPGAAFYRLAAERAGAKPADIAFIDDALPNVEAARRAGWAALHWQAGSTAQDLAALLAS
jgi:putative hydrolase of the HAD superfamily